jgi:hypothetical protein
VGLSPPSVELYAPAHTAPLTGRVRIVAKVPTNLEYARRRLARTEGWALAALCRMLIMLGTRGSYLILRSSELPCSMSNGYSTDVLEQYLGARAYALHVEDPAIKSLEPRSNCLCATLRGRPIFLAFSSCIHERTRERVVSVDMQVDRSNLKRED